MLICETWGLRVESSTERNPLVSSWIVHCGNARELSKAGKRRLERGEPLLKADLPYQSIRSKDHLVPRTEFHVRPFRLRRQKPLRKPAL